MMQGGWDKQGEIHGADFMTQLVMQSGQVGGAANQIGKQITTDLNTLKGGNLNSDLTDGGKLPVAIGKAFSDALKANNMGVFQLLPG